MKAPKLVMVRLDQKLTFDWLFVRLVPIGHRAESPCSISGVSETLGSSGLASVSLLREAVHF